MTSGTFDPALIDILTQDRRLTAAQVNQVYSLVAPCGCLLRIDCTIPVLHMCRWCGWVADGSVHDICNGCHRGSAVVDLGSRCIHGDRT